MKKTLIAIISATVLLTACGGGDKAKFIDEEGQGIIEDAIETIQLHMDGKMNDDEAAERLMRFYDQLDAIETVSDNAAQFKGYALDDIQHAADAVAYGDSAIDDMKDLQEYVD